MNTFAIIRALTGCDGTVDIATMDRSHLQELVKGIGLGRSVLAGIEAAAVARLTEIDCETMAEHTLSGHGGLSSAEARAAVRRANVISAMPLFDDALVSGAVTPGHVDAVARGLKSLGDKSDMLVAHQERLVAQAAFLPVGRYAKWVMNLAGSLDQQSENNKFQHQQRSAQLRMWEDMRTGMIKMSGQFDVETGSRLWTILDAAVESMFHGPSAGSPVAPASGVEPNDHRRALALCSLVEAGASVLPEDECGHRPESRVGTEVVVTIDLDTLVNGVHDSSERRDLNGVTLPVDVIRRMACDAGIIPMVLNSDGVVVDVGRANRLATKRQRRAIFAMHDTCAAPGCGVRVKHCVPHHIRWWESGGGTDLDNLVPLCSRHHHAVHEGGWDLSMDESRRVRMVPPDRGAV